MRSEFRDAWKLERIGCLSRRTFFVNSVDNRVLPPMLSGSAWHYRCFLGKMLIWFPHAHPGVACFRGQRKYGEAEPLYREALAIGEKVYGHHHPEVATNLYNLAALLQSRVRPVLLTELSHWTKVLLGSLEAFESAVARQK